tara:strand:- start:1509 stop:2060 length:552 start_codon:yes stop_codon:yes gene_type:complete
MSVPFLTLPGLACSGPNHWQSIWEQQHPELFHRVEQENWDWPVKEDWVLRLQQEVSKLTEPAYLVAHSMGCITAVHWAQQFTSDNIQGAFLVAPADTDESKRLNFVVGFRPIPLVKLPFKSIVIASSNDIYASFDRSQYFAEKWGSEFVDIGKKGHINAVSGLGDWQFGKTILSNFSKIKIVS